jgi:hypothetical protein
MGGSIRDTIGRLIGREYNSGRGGLGIFFPHTKSHATSKWPGRLNLGAPSIIALLLNALPTEMHAHEMHAHEMHAHEVHAHEVHAHEAHAISYSPRGTRPRGTRP